MYACILEAIKNNSGERNTQNDHFSLEINDTKVSEKQSKKKTAAEQITKSAAIQ